MMSAIWPLLESSFAEELANHEHPFRSLFGSPEKTDRSKLEAEDHHTVELHLSSDDLAEWEAGRSTPTATVKKLVEKARLCEDNEIATALKPDRKSQAALHVVTWRNRYAKRASGLAAPRKDLEELRKAKWLADPGFPNQKLGNERPGAIALTDTPTAPIAVFDRLDYTFKLAQDWRLDWDYTNSRGRLLLIASATFTLEEAKGVESPKTPVRGR